MSELRRQKRRAIRESKRNLTTTKIDNGLAILLDAYLKDKNYFKKQVELCKKLNLEYPKNAKTGYELPLFNKNPITNEIEIHAKSAELFTAYQLIQKLADSTVGMDDEDDEYRTILMFISAIDLDVSFAIYLYDLMRIGEEKQKPFTNIIMDNNEEINKKISKIFADTK
jgi:hypothetical protein